MRRTVGRALLAVAATAGWAGLPSGPATASSTVESGWWNEAAVGPVAAPSATPADQLQVSNGFSGPLAFAAVRYSVPAATPGSDIVTLRLAIPSGSTVGTPAVSACPTSGTWKPGPDQAPSGAPGYSCRSGHQADGTAAATGESWVLPVAWTQNGSLSVALVPTPGTSAPFSVTFTAPTAASLTVGPPPAAASGAGPPTGSSSPAPPAGSGSAAPGPAASAAGTPTAAPGPGAAAVAAPGPVLGSYPGAAPAPVLGAAPTGGPGPQIAPARAAPTGASSTGAPLAAAPGGGTPRPGPANRAGRIMAFCLLVALGLAAWFLAAQPDRSPRLLGPLTTRMRPAVGGTPGARSGPDRAPRPAPVRGVGRFARPRTGPPRRI